MSRLKKFFFFIGYGLLLALLIVQGLNLYNSGEQYSANHKTFTFPKQAHIYDTLLMANPISIKSGFTFFSPKRNPMSLYRVNEKYDLIVTRLEAKSSEGLLKMLSFKDNRPVKNRDDVYDNSVNTSQLDFQRLEDPPTFTGKLYLNLFGRNCTWIKETDEVCYLKIAISSGSLGFAVNSSDYYFSRMFNIAFRSPTIEIMLLKKQDEVFFLLLNPLKMEEVSEENVLGGLVNFKE